MFDDLMQGTYGGQGACGVCVCVCVTAVGGISTLTYSKRVLVPCALSPGLIKICMFGAVCDGIARNSVRLLY